MDPFRSTREAATAAMASLQFHKQCAITPIQSSTRKPMTTTKNLSITLKNGF